MAFPEMTDDMNIIAKLSDEPNEDDGLSAAGLKATFDKAGLLAKSAINRLTRALNAKTAAGDIGFQRTSSVQADTVQSAIENVQGQLAGVSMGSIPDGAVTATKLAPGAVNEDKIAPGAVTEGKLAADAVTAGNLAAGAVTEDKLASAAVTAAKLADGAVNGDKLDFGAVGTAHLLNGAVTSAKLAPGAAGWVRLTTEQAGYQFSANFCQVTSNNTQWFYSAALGMMAFQTNLTVRFTRENNSAYISFETVGPYIPASDMQTPVSFYYFNAQTGATSTSTLWAQIIGGQGYSDGGISITLPKPDGLAVYQTVTVQFGCWFICDAALSTS